jgi:hypothetical protein
MQHTPMHWMDQQLIEIMAVYSYVWGLHLGIVHSAHFYKTFRNVSISNIQVPLIIFSLFLHAHFLHRVGG